MRLVSRLRRWAGATVPPFEHGALQTLGPSILMTDAAWAVLTCFRADLLHVAHGNAPTGAWMPGADTDRFLGAVRKLASLIAELPPPGDGNSFWHPGADVPSKMVGPLVAVAALLDATGVAPPHRLLGEPFLLVMIGKGICDLKLVYTRLG